MWATDAMASLTVAFGGRDDPLPKSRFIPDGSVVICLFGRGQLSSRETDSFFGEGWTHPIYPVRSPLEGSAHPGLGLL